MGYISFYLDGQVFFCFLFPQLGLRIFTHLISKTDFFAGLLHVQFGNDNFALAKHKNLVTWQ